MNAVRRLRFEAERLDNDWVELEMSGLVPGRIAKAPRRSRRQIYILLVTRAQTPVEQ